MACYGSFFLNFLLCVIFSYEKLDFFNSTVFRLRLLHVMGSKTTYQWGEAVSEAAGGRRPQPLLLLECCHFRERGRKVNTHPGWSRKMGTLWEEKVLPVSENVMLTQEVWVKQLCISVCYSRWGFKLKSWSKISCFNLLSCPWEIQRKTLIDRANRKFVERVHG